MTSHQMVISVIASMLLTGLVIDLVRLRRLREEYAVLWVVSGLVMLVTSLHPSVINLFARLLGIEHAAYSIFVLALFLGLVLAIHLTMVVSKLTAQTWKLVQEVGLLKAEVARLERQNEVDQNSAAPGAQTR